MTTEGILRNRNNREERGEEQAEQDEDVILIAQRYKKIKKKTPIKLNLNKSAKNSTPGSVIVIKSKAVNPQESPISATKSANVDDSNEGPGESRHAMQNLSESMNDSFHFPQSSPGSVQSPRNLGEFSKTDNSINQDSRESVKSTLQFSGKSSALEKNSVGVNLEKGSLPKSSVRFKEQKNSSSLGTNDSFHSESTPTEFYSNSSSEESLVTQNLTTLLDTQFNISKLGMNASYTDWERRAMFSTSTGIDVLSFGRVVNESEFHSSSLIFPVGYVCRVMFTRSTVSSSKSIELSVPHLCEVLEDSSSPSPLFRITAADRPDEPIEESSMTDCWDAMIERIQQDINPDFVGDEILNDLVYFGLDHPEIKHIIEMMDIEKVCTKAQRKATSASGNSSLDSAEYSDEVVEFESSSSSSSSSSSRPAYSSSSSSSLVIQPLKILPDTQFNSKIDSNSRTLLKTQNGIEVLNFGSIERGDRFHSSRLIFPVGYTCKIALTGSKVSASKSRGQSFSYICEVLKSSIGNYPLFRISSLDRPGRLVEEQSVSECWDAVIGYNRRYLSNFDEDVFRLNYESFGLDQPEIKSIVEAMDEAKICTNYWDSSSHEIDWNNRSTVASELKALLKKMSLSETDVIDLSGLKMKPQTLRKFLDMPSYTLKSSQFKSLALWLKTNLGEKRKEDTEKYKEAINDSETSQINSSDDGSVEILHNNSIGDKIDLQDGKDSTCDWFSTSEESRLKPLHSHSVDLTVLKLGDSLDIKHSSGVWYRATIRKVQNGRILVHYEQGIGLLDEWVIISHKRINQPGSMSRKVITGDYTPSLSPSSQPGSSSIQLSENESFFESSDVIAGKSTSISSPSSPPDPSSAQSPENETFDVITGKVIPSLSSSSQRVPSPAQSPENETFFASSDIITGKLIPSSSSSSQPDPPLAQLPENGTFFIRTVTKRKHEKNFGGSSRRKRTPDGNERTVDHSSAGEKRRKITPREFIRLKFSSLFEEKHIPDNKEWKSWTEDDVCKWLTVVNLQRLAPTFRKLHVCGPMLDGINQEILQGLFHIENPLLRSMLLYRLHILTTDSNMIDEQEWDSWSPHEVCEFFSEFPYQVPVTYFREKFMENQVDGSCLKFLNEEILAYFGIPSIYISAFLKKLDYIFEDGESDDNDELEGHSERCSRIR